MGFDSIMIIALCSFILGLILGVMLLRPQHTVWGDDR